MFKRVLSMLLIVAMIMTMTCMPVLAETEEQNNGDFLVEVTSLTEVPDGYIGIYTKEDLDNVRNNLEANYILMNDIVFQKSDFEKGGAFYNDGQGWLPIGNHDGSYLGVFDGNGKVISGLVVNNTIRKGGLFYEITNTVKNLGLEGGTITATVYDERACIGAITGSSSGIIKNCFNKNNMNIESIADKSGMYYRHYIGGLVGTCGKGAVVQECYNEGEIDVYFGEIKYSSSYADFYVGGIVGYFESNNSEETIKNCFNFGKINGAFKDIYAYIGGIVGKTSSLSKDLEIVNCGNYGEINFNDEEPTSALSGRLGGIAGDSFCTSFNTCYNVAQLNCFEQGYVTGIVGWSCGSTIKNCYNIAPIVGEVAAGIAYNGETVDNCFNEGIIIGKDSACGIIHESDYVSNCYNTGDIMGYDNLSRAMGIVNKAKAVEYCYNSGNISADGNAAGIAGYLDSSAIVRQCFNNGAVTGGGYIAGIILGMGSKYGYNSSSKIAIEDCYNTGHISGKAHYFYENLEIGGIVARLTEDNVVKNCYNVGQVIHLEPQISYGESYVGSIVGNYQEYYNSGKIGKTENCYTIKGISDVSNDVKALSLTQMKDKSSYENFDFDSVWLIDDKSNYPFPKLKSMQYEMNSNLGLRLAGSNRYGTSAEISKGFVKDGDANAIVIVNGLGFADALAATPFAANLGAPILMSDGPGGKLDPTVIDEINRIDPDHNAKIYLIGGEGAVSPQVVTKLVSIGYSKNSIDRVAGDNRYKTAIEVAKRMPQAKTAYIAYGLNYPDALGGGSAAALNDGVVLFTSDKSLTPETKAYLESGNFDKIVILGGEGVVSKDVENTLKGMFGSSNVSRAAGKDRFLTSVEIAKKYFAKTDTVVIATGMNYADALAGGPLAAELNAPMLLVYGTGTTIPSEMIDYIRTSGAKNVVVLGGTGAVSDAIMGQIAIILNS